MRCVFPYFKNDSFHIQIQHVVVFTTKWLETTFKIKWLEKPEYKCLSQMQNKFKAASCNVCIKDINISNIGGRVDLKVTFSQQNTLNILKKSSLRLSMWVNNQVEPASVQSTKKLLEEFVATTDFIKVEI
jgi:hypothetical protein